MNQLVSLIEHDIPIARQNLLDNHKNLEKVAIYCETNYFQADDKRQALQETKDYTTRSLASIAYQINTLACQLLHMLSLQSDHLDEMESQINHISQTIAIHKEKVARREIGVLTTNKCINNQHKILVPANPERPIKYTRKPIDYSILDDIGHGVKIPQQNQQRTKRLGSASGIYGETGLSGTAPTSKPPNPPHQSTLSRHTGSNLGLGTLSRNSKEYRTPVPVVAPPKVPSNYAANYPQGHPRAQEQQQQQFNNQQQQRRSSGYSTLPMNIQQQQQQLINNNQQPQIGMVHPISQLNNSQQSQNNYQQTGLINTSTTPPPPPPPIHDHLHDQSPISDSLPLPPFHQQISNNNSLTSNNLIVNTDQRLGSSPPLPSPPAMDDSIYTNQPHNNSSIVQNTTNNDWIPKQYVEKVIAVYDYNASRNDELSFKENSIIYVIKKNDDGWYEGVMDGITGLFPGNYVSRASN